MGQRYVFITSGNGQAYYSLSFRQKLSKPSSIFCFTETHTSEYDFKGIKEYHKGTWDSVHEHSGHGFALCYDTCKVEIIEDGFDVVFENLEIFPVGMKLQTNVSYWY